MQYISLELYKQFCYVLDFHFFLVFNICVLYYTVCHTIIITKLIIIFFLLPTKTLSAIYFTGMYAFYQIDKYYWYHIYQLDAGILYFNTLLIFLHMFRAILCSSSGRQLYLYSIWSRQSICVTVQYTGYWWSPLVTLYWDAGSTKHKKINCRFHSFQPLHTSPVCTHFIKLINIRFHVFEKM